MSGSELQPNLSTLKEIWFKLHIVLTIYIKIYRLFNKILRFLKIGKLTKIFLNISPPPFGSLEKIVLARVFKGQSAFFSYRFYIKHSHIFDG